MLENSKINNVESLGLIIEAALTSLQS
jgi:hypothetical protein